MTRPKCTNCSERHATILCPYEMIGGEVTSPTSRTQLEEAIHEALKSHERDYTKYTGESASDKRKTSSARILSAVDAHVKRVLGEEEIYDHSEPFSAQKDRWNEKIAPRILLRAEQRLRAGLEENHGA